MEDIRPLAEEYFSSLNPIAKRILQDVRSTRENYESAWNYLSSEEQAQVINESLIYPDAILKYSINEKESHILPDSFSTLKISYGCKILQDETGSQWRDEHSAPFSWKTASQLFISPPTKSTPKKESKPTPRKKPPVPPPKPPKPVMKIENNVEETVVISNKNMGLETTIPYSDSAQSLQNEEVISSNRDSLNSQDIPKTGYEFLDNW